MARVTWRSVALLVCAAAFAATAFPAQSAEQKPAEQSKTDAVKEGAGGHGNEVAEPNRVASAPPSRGECGWLGKRAVRWMWQDDLDTAFRYLDLYDRFGCPGEHVQVTFRCVIRQVNTDPKVATDPKAAANTKAAEQPKQAAIDPRLDMCWDNPASPPPAPTTAAVEKPGTK